MGRVKTALIKRTVKQLLKEYKDKFMPKFEDNKKLLAETTEIPSKKLRNIVAGYLARQVKQLKQNPTSKESLKTQI